MTVEALRADIDAVDDALLQLLAQRAGLVRQVWQRKQESGAPRLDVAREAEVLGRLRARAEALALDPADVERIWREILRVRSVG